MLDSYNYTLKSTKEFTITRETGHDITRLGIIYKDVLRKRTSFNVDESYGNIIMSFRTHSNYHERPLLNKGKDIINRKTCFGIYHVDCMLLEQGYSPYINGINRYV